MGDTSVRAAVVAYFRGQTITGLAKWYRDEPWRIEPPMFNLQANGGWGAIGFVHLDSAHETRLTVGGVSGVTPTGSREVSHTVSLVISYRYQIPTALPAGTDEDAWVAPLDTMLDQIKSAIRADPTLGTSAIQPNPTINWAGQAYGGSPDIRQIRDLPIQDTNRTTVICWNRVEFDLVEFIQG